MCNIWVGTGALDVQHVQSPCGDAGTRIEDPYVAKAATLLLVVPGRSNIASLWKQVDISEDIV